MAITVTIPTALRRFADNQASVEVQGKTITEVLDNLTTQHTQLRQHLYDGNGKLRNFVRVYVNDEDIRAKGDNAPLNDGDEISIVPSIAGGIAVFHCGSDIPVAPGRNRGWKTAPTRI